MRDDIAGVVLIDQVFYNGAGFPEGKVGVGVLDRGHAEAQVGISYVILQRLK